jgi:hypothetical protein
MYTCLKILLRHSNSSALRVTIRDTQRRISGYHLSVLSPSLQKENFDGVTIPRPSPCYQAYPVILTSFLNK